MLIPSIGVVGDGMGKHRRFPWSTWERLEHAGKRSSTWWTRRSGACRMVVKVPLTEPAGEAILREAGVLDALAREPRVRAPRLLEVDRQRGIASQGFIAGTPGDRKLTAEHCGLLGSLLLENETATIIGQAAALQEQALLLPGQLRELLSDALSQLSASRLLPACWTHGDFAPWNIRHCPDGTPVLIDWESAHRGGLPLHDAFHFLHMQDYLFSHRAHSHCAAVRDYGLSLDLSADECRQLEIAYLVSAYLSCTEQEETRRADFHLSALDLLLRPRRRRQVQVTEAADQPLANPVRNAQGRTELFAAALSQFNLAEIPYCLLGGHENRAASADSDVDVMVASHELTRVGSLLAQVASSANAMLVQALRHESSACYFVLAKAEGAGFSFLDVDCCGDYRRRGRLWLRAYPILARRKACRNLFVPAASDQFIYYTIKKILKQSISAHQLKRIAALVRPRSCRLPGKPWRILDGCHGATFAACHHEARPISNAGPATRTVVGAQTFRAGRGSHQALDRESAGTGATRATRASTHRHDGVHHWR